ncbi:putative effector protein, partial [Blumeria hordei DH14]
AVYGEFIYECWDGARFDIDTIKHYALLGTPEQATVLDPPYEDGKIYGVYHFTKSINNKKSKYLVQTVEKEPFILFFDVTSFARECQIIDINA